MPEFIKGRIEMPRIQGIPVVRKNTAYMFVPHKIASPGVFRITEDDDFRITEDGNFRILEHPV